MALHRTRKQKEMPHYGFLVSWQPKPNSQARVKGELKSGEKSEANKLTPPKKANNLAQAGHERNLKKDIVRSILVVSFILILELVVYLAWIKFGLS
jgi:hypothetical protein